MHEQTSTVRIYSTIIKRGNIFLLREFKQIKGEYQEKKSEMSFSHYDHALLYLEKTKKFKKLSVLDYWKVVNNTNLENFFEKRHQFIWEAKNQWDDNWEMKYAQWIETEVGEDFYVKKKIATDCADALIGLRWIFARINYLPVANTLSDSGNLFGHFSMNKKWSKLKKAEKWYDDEVFISALNYIMDLTSTRTLIRDGYAIKLDDKSIKAGLYLITLNNTGGHAKIISRANFREPTELPLFTLASTTPRAIRNLVTEIMVDHEWPSKGTKELLAFKWPILIGNNWKLMSAESHPNYSEEQFDLKLRENYPAFISYILFKMKGTVDPLKLIEQASIDIKSYLNQRIELVNNGYEYCFRYGCSENSNEYEEWSTPHRDLKLLKKFSDIDKMVSALEYLSPGLSDYWLYQLRNQYITIENRDLSFSNIRYLFENKFYSSNPNHHPKKRWGINSANVLSIWFNKIIDLLKVRAEKVNSTSKCNEDCHPKSLEWITLNSYSIDSQLQKLVSQVRSYCHVISNEFCRSEMDHYYNRELVLNNYQKKIGDWLNLINSFHSDPRMTFERRWGVLIDEQIIELPYFETISISNNGLALIDSKQLIDLNDDGKLLLYSKSRLVLTKEGVIYSIEKDKIKFATYSRNGITPFNDVLDPEHILDSISSLLVSYSELEGYGIFRKYQNGKSIAFRIKNGIIEMIDEYIGYSSQYKSLLILKKNDSELNFVDLKISKMHELDFSEQEQIKNIQKIKVIDYEYPYVVADYDDQEWGTHFPILINLATASIHKINLDIAGDYQIKGSSAKQFKMFVVENWNNEMPNLNAIKFDEKGNCEIFRLTNSLLGFVVLKNEIYFAEGTGNQWGNQVKKLQVWTDKFSTIKEDLKEIQIIGNYAYISSDKNASELIDLATKRNYKAIDNLEFGLDLGVSSERSYLSYHYDTSYGEYYRMGGVIDVGTLSSQEQYNFKPHVSIYPSLDNNLIDSYWKNALMGFSIGKGMLISTGINSAYWWNITK